MLDIAIEAARAAGEVLRQGMRTEAKVIARPAHDIKLEMDQKAEDAIVRILREATPDYEILTEEAGRIGKNAEYRWVIDPLDGTYNYFRGIPCWVTSIALFA